MEFSKGAGNNQLVYPLTSVILQPSRLVNPKVGRDHGYKIPDFFDIDESCKEVLRVREYVKKGQFPYWFMDKYNPFKSNFGSFPRKTLGPLEMEGLSFDRPEGLAQVVHMDFTSDLGNAIHRWLLREGYNVKAHTPNHINFLESVPNVEYKLATNIDKALNKAFEMKYYFGVARPEEVIGSNMTHYPEGCPNHPATPAGHSAVAGTSGRTMIDCFEVDLKAIKVILFTSYTWAQARTFAGVHHAVDNIMGLMSNGLEVYMKGDIVKQYKK